MVPVLSVEAGTVLSLKGPLSLLLSGGAGLDTAGTEVVYQGQSGTLSPWSGKVEVSLLVQLNSPGAQKP